MTANDDLGITSTRAPLRDPKFRVDIRKPIYVGDHIAGYNVYAWRNGRHVWLRRELL